MPPPDWPCGRGTMNSDTNWSTKTCSSSIPDADPALAQLIRKVIVDARSRQEILAAAMPSRFERGEEVGFVASPTRGGFVPQADPAATADRLATRRIRTGWRQPLRRGPGRGPGARRTDPPRQPTADAATAGPDDAAGCPGAQDRRRCRRRWRKPAARIGDCRNARPTRPASCGPSVSPAWPTA